MASRLVLPAHAGMARSTADVCRGSPAFSPHTRGWPEATQRQGNADQGSPRTRGDGPWEPDDTDARCLRSPRTRGDGPGVQEVATIPSPVLPAHAGMARGSSTRRSSAAPVLPAHAGMARDMRRFCGAVSRVLPAHAGMARVAGVSGDSSPRSPRTRGDGPHSR